MHLDDLKERDEVIAWVPVDPDVPCECLPSVYNQCKSVADLVVFGSSADSEWGERVESLPDDALCVTQTASSKELVEELQPDVRCRPEHRKGAVHTHSEMMFFYHVPDTVSAPSLEETQKPPALHFFWSGSHFSYARYLSVLSGRNVHNPDRTIVWTLQEPSSNEWWKGLSRLSDVEIRSASELLSSELLVHIQSAWERVREEMYDYHDPAQIIYVKDVVMWACLEEYGGIFCDIDTLSYRPFWKKFLERDGTFLHCGDFPGTGVLAATPDSSVPGRLMEWIRNNVDDLSKDVVEALSRWNAWTYFGPHAIRTVRHDIAEESVIVPMDWFYRYASRMDELFTADEPPEETYVVHYYGEGRDEQGADVDPHGLVTPDYIEESMSPFARIAREVCFEGTEAQEATDNLITLTAIFADEEDNVERCFGSVVDIVDQWILCNTGAEDNTEEVMRDFFAEHNIPEIPDDDPYAPGYKIYHREWKGYTRSRQEALDLALDHAGGDGYIMKMDLDEEMVGAQRLRNAAERCDPDAIFTYCYQGSKSSTRFAFPRAAHVRTDPRYVGSDHELLDFDLNKRPTLMHDCLDQEELNCYILHHQGNRDEDGYLDTAMLLRKDIDEAWARGGRDTRAEFYLARDLISVDPIQSLYWFQYRATAEGDEHTDPEHTYFNYLYWGDLLKQLGRFEDAIDKWEKAHEVETVGKKCREAPVRLAEMYYSLADQEEDPEEALPLWKKADEWAGTALSIDELPDIILFLEAGLYESEKTAELKWTQAVARYRSDPRPETAVECLELMEPWRDADDSRAESTIQFFENKAAQCECESAD